jgi:hypothetical protein
VSDEIYRRLDKLENVIVDVQTRSAREISELTIAVRLTAQSVDNLSKIIESHEHLRGELVEIDKRLSRVESGYGALKLLGGGAALSIIGLAVTAIFGAR